MPWFLRRTKPSLASPEKEALRKYLAEELKLAAFRDREAANYYTSGGSAAAGLSRFQSALDEIVARHSTLAPPAVKQAVENHRAWQVTYEAYQQWLSRVARTLRAGNEPDLLWIQKATSKALAAAKHTESLHRLLGITPAEIAELSRIAVQAFDAESWNPQNSSSLRAAERLVHRPRCSACGSEAPQAGRFCTNCGELLEQQEQESPVEPIPRPGDTIEFDEEEQRGIRSGMPSGLDEMNFEQEIGDMVQATFMGYALQSVAERRLQKGDYQAAAATCVKAIGLTQGALEPWLLLAEVHAATGDFGRSERALKEALACAEERKESPHPWPSYEKRFATLKSQISNSK